MDNLNRIRALEAAAQRAQQSGGIVINGGSHEPSSKQIAQMYCKQVAHQLLKLPGLREPGGVLEETYAERDEHGDTWTGGQHDMLRIMELVADLQDELELLQRKAKGEVTLAYPNKAERERHDLATKLADSVRAQWFAPAHPDPDEPDDSKVLLGHEVREAVLDALLQYERERP